MPHAPTDIRSLARQWTGAAIRTLGAIATDPDEDAGPRVSACIALLDRGWGKAPQAHTGENGEGAIKVLVRHIINGKDVNGPLIEHKQPLPIGRDEEK